MSAPVNAADAPLLLFEHSTDSGHVLAEARLNAEATLNALSLAMIDILRPALDRWQQDERVAAVVLTGSGERAFSAGGDIQALYRAMVKNHEAGEVVDDYPFRFFEQEYRLDYRLHTYPKPLVSIGHGVVMGGGLGVFSGARWRVVTETTRIAMPEVTIGLFPDAGATWLLQGMPRHVATFAAMTGVHLNGSDALATGIGTHAVAARERHGLLDGLRRLAWRGRAEDDAAAVQAHLDALPAVELPPSRVVGIPEELSPDGALLDAVTRVRALAGRDEWIDKGIETMNRGCPTSVGIVVRQLQRLPGLKIGDCFRLEMVVATHCAHERDFAEGVRALIIDKDNRPRWRYPDLESLPVEHVDAHFVPPWPKNPLEDLEEGA
ncbi:MAG TPA: enoyl-CoA hydratase/isomerase family protein [Pseudomonadales bacterium]